MKFSDLKNKIHFLIPIAVAVVTVLSVSIWALIGRGVRGADEAILPPADQNEYREELGEDKKEDVIEKPAEITLEVPQNNIGYKSGTHTITGDDTVKIVEKYISESQDYTSMVIIEKINAKESFANEYRISAKEAKNLLTILRADENADVDTNATAISCICMPTHRVKYNGKVYNVSITTRDYSHFTVGDKKYDLNVGEYYSIYEIFQKYVSKDYFVVTKKIDTDFKYSGDIKVTAKITEYLKEMGQQWPSSPETIEFTITGDDAQALYKNIRLNTYSYNKNYYNDYDVEFEIDGRKYRYTKYSIATENGEECILKADDEFVKLLENCFNKALKEQGLDKETLENRKNIVEYENHPQISDCGGPCGFYFDSIDETVTAIKTHEYTMSDTERKHMEAYCNRISDKSDRLDALSKIGTKDDFRFENYKIDNIKYFYKIKDSKLSDFRLDQVNVDYMHINYKYIRKTNPDEYIYVRYRRPDSFDFETDSYFDDYVEYYGTDVLTKDGFIFNDYDTSAMVMFAVENTYIEISAHGSMANYNALKKLCVAQKIIVK